MQLVYEISARDHLEYVKVRYRASVRRWAMTVLGVILLSFGLATYPYFDRGWGAAIVTLAAWILLLQLFLPRIVHWLTYHRNRKIFGPRCVSFDAGGLIADGPQGHIETPWNKYLHFRETKRLFLLYLSRDVVGIVPKRVFKDVAETQAFREVISAHLPRA